MAMLVAFDVLEVDGFDFRDQPVERRRALLSELLAGAPAELVISETIQGDGAAVFRHACSMGLEGIVSKRFGSKYRAGPSPDWVKMKNPSWVRR